jgi:two-component system, OmpR family, alkaline phosphatase synthesis response regulator PhoP
LEKTNYRILIVDDEPDILEFLGYNLLKEGYQVLKALSGKEGIELVKTVNPHLIVLDIMMPGMDGIETCREIRQLTLQPQPLIMFLTARSEDYTQIAGLDAGGDDYVSKPVKPRVLVSRINALLRRYDIEEPDDGVLIVDDLVIDKDKYIVIKDGNNILLPKKEFELLFLLASKSNKVFTRNDILDKIWGDDIVVGERTIDVHIRKIREKIGIDNIKTIKGVGYKYEI